MGEQNLGTRLQGKGAFVTGAGSGIGAATALRFAEEGARVVLCGRRIEPLQAVAAQIRDSGGCAECAVADVSNEAAYVAAINDAAQRHGRLDILVNNAMAYSWGAIDSTSTADWHSNFATTVDGTFWGTRTALGLMRQGRLTITKKGKPVDPNNFRGVIRLRLPTEAETAVALAALPPVEASDDDFD